MVAFVVVMMIICWNQKKIGSPQFYFIFASRVFMVIAINYYNCIVQTPKGLFFCTNGDLCGGGGCHYPLVCFLWFFWFHPNTMGRLTHHKKLIDFLFLNLTFLLEIFSCIEHIVRSSTPCNKLLHSFFQLFKKKINLTIWCNFFIFKNLNKF